MSRTVDLIAEGNLTAGYLDQAPPIDISLYARANIGDGSLNGTLSFAVSLLDANQNAIKTYQTADVTLAHGRWIGGGCSFYGYGPGARYLSYSHSAALVPTDNEPIRIYFPSISVTGIEAGVHLAIEAEPPELVTNPSGASQLSGWSITTGSFTIDPANGLYCLGSAGTTAFATGSSDWNVMTQSIDLSSTYTAAQLDSQPTISVSDWICAMPSCVCQYELIVSLLNAAGTVMQTFDSGVITLPANTSDAPSFIYVPGDLDNYGSGLQTITITRRALSETNGTSALLAGASVVIYLNPVEVQETDMRDEAATEVGLRISDTQVEPYKWVTATKSEFVGKSAKPPTWGSGWAITGGGPNLIVVTAAHNVYDSESGSGNGWATKGTVAPGQSGATQPFGCLSVSASNMQISFDYLAIDQASVMAEQSSDYGAFCAGYIKQPRLGFTPAIPTLSAPGLGVIIGYPGNLNTSASQRAMFSEQVTLVSSGTALGVPTIFGAGASGSPICRSSDTSTAIGIFVNAGRWPWSTPQATALSDSVIADLTAWLTPLGEDDEVTDFRFVVQTANESFAGTDAGISVTICEIQYRPLSSYWVGLPRDRNSQNERGRWDGYDLTAALLQDLPGLLVSDLLNSHFTIGMINNDEIGYFAPWKLASVIFFINRRRFTLREANVWLSPSGAYTSTFTLS